MAIHTLDWHGVPPVACHRGALAIGNFDGVHRGHGALVAELVKQAKSVGGPAVVLTFDPHPLQLLRPKLFMPVLTTIGDRAELLREAGADEVLILKTTLEVLQLSAADFFEQLVRERLDAQAMVEGFNFAFGRNREGTLDRLRELCDEASVGLTIVPPWQYEGITVSSSKVRDALLSGAVGAAARLLGRPYRLHGQVGTGQRRGQQIGFPTANLERTETLIPADGVYAVRAFWRGQSWPAAANVGPNPTFGEQARKVEVHLIDFQGDLYGQPFAVDFVERLRDTRPFAGVAELVAQLRKDVEQARRLVT